MRTLHIPLPIWRAWTRFSLGFIVNPRISWERQRALLAAGTRSLRPPPGTQVETLTLGGRPTDVVTSQTRTPGSAVLLLHGGGYTTLSPATHHALAGLIARDTGVAVYLPDYRLAPEYPFPAALDDVFAAFVDLIDNHGFAADRIAVAGDSAGGALALAATRRLIDQRGLRPAALGLLSPWVDPEAVLPAARDTVLNVAWVRACAAAYRGSASTTDPEYAPLHGDLSGLPPTLVQIGTTELFHPQSLRLVAKIKASGGEVTLQEFPALWHAAHMQAVQIPEAGEAVAQLADFLRARLQPVNVEPGSGDIG